MTPRSSQKSRSTVVRPAAVNRRFTMSSGISHRAGIWVRGLFARLTPRSPLNCINRSRVQRATSEWHGRRCSYDTFLAPYAPQLSTWTIANWLTSPASERARAKTVRDRNT